MAAPARPRAAASSAGSEAAHTRRTRFRLRHPPPRHVVALLVLELAFHVLGVAEIWYSLSLLAGAAAPTLLSTFVLESVNRTIMVVFKFVPLRLGVDEVGTELLTRTLGLPIGIGVTMAIVRKARMIVWSAIGIVFLVRRGSSRRRCCPRPTDDPDGRLGEAALPREHVAPPRPAE